MHHTSVSAAMLAYGEMPARRAFYTGVGGALAGVALAVACGNAEHPPPAGSAAPGASGGRDGGLVIFDGSFTDVAPVCGGERIRALVDPPKVYFVLDRSGSMADPIDASGVAKYRAAWRAVGSLLRAIGHRVAYGAALFPAEGAVDCGGAREIFPTTPGDPPGSAPRDQNGPILQALMDRFTHYEPDGATPTRAALNALRPGLEALGERTHLVLATDGAPNCNEDVRCESSTCIPDIERHPIGAGYCGDTASCCDEAFAGPGAAANCIDGDGTVAAVREIADSGIPTYVIGMPGSEAYAALLSAMAEAGGTARSGPKPYYAITDEGALADALFDIGAGIAIQCELRLESAPPDADLVNVYFDAEVVPRDAEQGWDWTEDAALSLRGDACSALRSGAVLEVEIVYGCRTVVR